MTRREFLQVTAATAVAAGLNGSGALAADGGAPAKFKTQLWKALIAGKLDGALCDKLAAAGFPGVELMDKSVTLAEARAARNVAESRGIKIHSFMGGWAEFGDPNPAVRAKAIEGVKNNIRLTAAYGAPVILLVPGRVGGVAIPKPSQFKLDWDKNTLMLKSVVEGDNAPFADYIKRHNEITKWATDAVNELIPVAAEEGVIIGLENVWNNLWVLPAFASDFIRSFNNPWVKCYLDLGNHVRYAPVEQWLEAMKGIIVKLHIKDCLVDRSIAGAECKFVSLTKGSINWKSVRNKIEEVGYNGWVSIEENGYSDKEYSEIMDKFFAGTL